MLHQREHGREGETGINGEYLSGAAVLESHRGKMGISHYMWLSQCFRILLFVIYLCVCVSFWCHEHNNNIFSNLQKKSENNVASLDANMWE